MTHDETIIALCDALNEFRSLNDWEADALAAAIRRQAARDGTRRPSAWGAAEDAALIAARTSGVPSAVIAKVLRRSIGAIDVRMYELRKRGMVERVAA